MVVSFRSLLPARVYRRAAVAALLAALLAGCGGGGRKHAPAPAVQHLSASGVRFDAPVGWQVVRTLLKVQATPGPGRAELVWAAVFTFPRRFPAGLGPTVVRSIDSAAAQLAVQLRGQVASRESVVVGRLPGRSYLIAFGTRRERIVFLLQGRHEYELLCRWDAGDPAAGQAACRLLLDTFRPG